VRNPERSSHKILSNAKSASIENEIHTYSVSERKNRNRHRPSKQFGPKLQRKKFINKKRTYLAWAFKLVWAFSNN